MTGCIIGSLACWFLIGVFITMLMASRSLQSREEEMREYYLAELEKMNGRKKDDGLSGRDGEEDPAPPADVRQEVGQ